MQDTTNERQVDPLAPTAADLAALDRALARDQLEQLLATAEEALL